MGKTLTFDSRYNADYVVNRSDVGNLTKIDATTIDATDATTTAIRNALGESTNNVGLLCTSSLINQWALFKPGNLSYDANKNIIYNQPSVYRMGDFLGYNHNAQVPQVNDAPKNYFEGDNTITVDIIYNEGEVDFSEMGSEIQYYWVVVYETDGTTVRKEESFAIDWTVKNQTLSVTLDVSQDSSDKNLPYELYLGGSTSKYALIGSANITLNYYKETSFGSIILDPDAQMAGYYPDSRYETVPSTDKVSFDVKIFDSNGYEVTANNVDILISVNGTEETLLSGQYISATWNSYDNVTVPQGIDLYGDTWSLRLITNLG